MTTVFGIPNCSSVKKARLWLAAQHIDYTFHDFKKLAIDADSLQRWIAAAGLERVLNRKGTTWRGLDAGTQAGAASVDGAVALMMRHPSLIKRPVIEHAGQILLGFDEEHYKKVFGR
jgi:Spx/MgsR family transcriptional regulator